MNDQEKLYVSIVIAVKNEIEYIEECLSSLINQNYPKEYYEILIYDGGSTDGTREYLKKINTSVPKISFLDNPKGIQAAAWNMGFRRSNADVVIMMGAHSFVNSSFLKNNVKALLEHPDVPCVGGVVETVGKDEKSRIIACTFNSRFGVGNARYRYAQEECFVETINYGAYRKSMIDQVAPIDESILRGQDWEYNFRLVKKFGKMLFTPTIRVFYYSRSNIKKLWKKQFDAGFWKIEIIKRHPNSFLLRHFIPFIFVSFLLTLLLFTFIGLCSCYLIFFLMIYFSASIIISFKLAIKNRFKNVLYLILAFFVVHFAYGLGFLVGLFRRLLIPKNR